jgi:tRNA A22 N-methylase
MLNESILYKPIASKITDIFCDHSLKPSNTLRTSKLFNCIFVEMVTADDLAEDEIVYQNLRYSQLRPELIAGSAVEHNMLMKLEVVDESNKYGTRFRD